MQEETKAQRGEAACPKSQSPTVATNPFLFTVSHREFSMGWRETEGVQAAQEGFPEADGGGGWII